MQIEVRQQPRHRLMEERNSVFHDVVKNELPVLTINQLSDIATIFIINLFVAKMATIC